MLQPRCAAWGHCKTAFGGAHAPNALQVMTMQLMSACVYVEHCQKTAYSAYIVQEPVRMVQGVSLSVLLVTVFLVGHAAQATTAGTHGSRPQRFGFLGVTPVCICA